MIQILAMYFAFPIDMCITDNLPASHDTCHIPFATRPVLIEEQLRGTCLAYSLEHPGEGVAAGKEQQQYGNIGFGRIFHTSSGMMNTEWIFCFSLGGISI